MFSYYRERGVDLSFVRDGDLQRISVPIDFLGINYYFRNTVATRRTKKGKSIPFADLGARPVIPHAAEKTAMGWPVEPDGLTEMLVRIKDEYADVPIYVTENGRAVHDYIDPEGDVDDEERISYLEIHFRAAHEAIEEGRRPARLHGVVVAGQLRVGRRVLQAVRDRVRGVRNAAARPEV